MWRGASSLHFRLKNNYVYMILTVCLLFFAACTSAGEEEEPTSEQEVITDENDNTTNMDNIEDSEIDTDSDDKVPNSTFHITQMSIGSVFYKSSMDIDSDFEREIMDTLTEYNAVETEDGAKLTLPEDILFDFDSSELRSDTGDVMDQLVQVIDTTDDDITIIGHTDSEGEDSYNQELSEERANAILDALVEAGVEENRLNAEGKGASEPIADNTNSDGSDNPEGRQQNRRVEVTVHGFNQ